MRTIIAGILLATLLAACQPQDINPALVPDEPTPVVTPQDPEPIQPKPYTLPVSYHSAVVGGLVYPTVNNRVMLLHFQLQYTANYRAELLDTMEQYMASQGLILGVDYQMQIDYEPRFYSSVITITGNVQCTGRGTRPFYPAP